MNFIVKNAIPICFVILSSIVIWHFWDYTPNQAYKPELDFINEYRLMKADLKNIKVSEGSNFKVWDSLELDESYVNMKEFTKVLEIWSKEFHIPYSVAEKEFENGNLEKLIIETKIKYQNIEIEKGGN